MPRLTSCGQRVGPSILRFVHPLPNRSNPTDEPGSVGPDLVNQHLCWQVDDVAMLVGPTARLGGEKLMNCLIWTGKRIKILGISWGARPRLGKVCRVGQGEVGVTHSDMVKEIWDYLRGIMHVKWHIDPFQWVTLYLLGLFHILINSNEKW